MSVTLTINNAETKLQNVATITMGTSPNGETYNRDEIGLPLLNGPTEFGEIHPHCTLYTTDSKRECESHDLIFCVRGSTTGRMNWADQSYSLGRGVCSIRGETLLDTRFIRYCMEWKLQELLNFAGGSTFSNLTKDTIRDFPIPYPESRHKIAAILNNYDDLIENNTRRIKILEEMAGTIYREWFVEFRFPGHENVKMVESELGLIPQGWEVNGLSNVCEVVPGYAFKSKDWQDSGVPVIKIKDIKSDNTVDVNNTACVSPEILSPKLEKYRLINGDFLIAMTGATAGKVGRLRTKTTMMLNQRVAKLNPINIYRDYIWCMISFKEIQDAFYRLADGAAQPNMSGSQIENYKIVCPPPSICNHFSSIVSNMLLLCDNLMLRNDNLRKTRDLLLPKLVSGELDVSELDITTDGAQPRKDGTHIPSSLKEWLHSDGKILAGKPVIKGTRLAVEFIIELLENHWSEEDILANYPNITREDIDACRAYQRKVLDAPVSG